MEAVKKIIDSKLLNGVVTLPKNFRDKKVEIIIFLSEEKKALPKLSIKEIDAMVKGSVSASLVGVLPDSGKSLEEYRTERLNKYEHTN